MAKIMSNIDFSSKILITGSEGLVGYSIMNELKNQGYKNLCGVSRKNCDLMDINQVRLIFSKERPDVVIHTAGHVCGIGGNALNPSEIFFNNILINTHVIETAKALKSQKIIAMGTVASYSDSATTPLVESSIWDGIPHLSERSYGQAKRSMLAHLEACKIDSNLDYAYLISTNLYGINDRFNKDTGHVIPSLICKFHNSKLTGAEISIWGDGTASRDFLFSEDLAKAVILIMNNFSGPINVGSGVSTAIKDVANFLGDYFDVSSNITWNSNMPNGRKKHELDPTNLKSLGFFPQNNIQNGLLKTAKWYENNFLTQVIRT